MLHTDFSCASLCYVNVSHSKQFVSTRWFNYQQHVFVNISNSPIESLNVSLNASLPGKLNGLWKCDGVWTSVVWSRTSEFRSRVVCSCRVTSSVTCAATTFWVLRSATTAMRCVERNIAWNIMKLSWFQKTRVGSAKSEEESTSGIAHVTTMQLLLQSVRTVARCAAQDLWFGSAKGSQLFPGFPSADTADAWSAVLDRHTPAPEGPTMGDQLWSKSLPGPPSTPRTAICLGDQTIHYGIARGHDLRHLQVAQARRIPQDPAGSQGRWPWSILKRKTPRKTRKTLSFDVLCIL